MNTQTSKASSRKLLVALPFLVLPFLTLAFWALGGGQVNAENKVAIDKGLNLKLPDAHNATDPMDKMSYYNQAAADSLKQKERGRNDPYYQQSQQPTAHNDSGSGLQAQGQYGNVNNGLAYHDPNEARVYEKLGQLNQTLHQPPQTASYPAYSTPSNPYQQQPGSSIDIDRLEKMMQAMQNKDTGDDPETKQLNGMLERILDIQHPEMVQEKIKASEAMRRGQVYAVGHVGRKERISLLDNTSTTATNEQDQQGNGFFGLGDTASSDNDQNAIEAVVHEDQTLVNGSTVKLRLLDDINVKGKIVPKDNFIYGTVSLDGERLTVKISSLRYKKSLFPVKLSVFDIDGLDGIYIPGAIARDVAKSSADRSIQTLGISSFDQSLGAQAAGAGIEAAKSFLSKKIKLIKVMVKAGYKVLLRDDSQKASQ
nr:conjugative transposon protein TraM [Mucilaginibacter sp. L294]